MKEISSVLFVGGGYALAAMVFGGMGALVNWVIGVRGDYWWLYAVVWLALHAAFFVSAVQERGENAAWLMVAPLVLLITPLIGIGFSFTQRRLGANGTK